MTTQADLAVRLNHAVLIDGFQNQSMSKLALAAGVSRATLYLYFKNKDEVITAVVDRHTRFIADNQIPHEATQADLPIVILNALLLSGATTETFAKQLAQSYPALALRLNQTTRNFFDQMAQYLRSAQKNKLVRNKLPVTFIMAEIQRGIRQILTDVALHTISSEDGAQQLQIYYDFFLHGLLTTQGYATIDFNDIQPQIDRIIGEFHATYGN